MNPNEAAYLNSKVGDLLGRMTVLERKVDYLLKALKVEYHDDTPPEPPYMVQVREFLRQDKLVDAIKVYKEHTGASLVDAQRFVQRLPKPE